MIRADDHGTDLRAAFEAARVQGGGEIALGPSTYTVPGGYTAPLLHGLSLRGEHGASRIQVVGDGDFTIGTPAGDAGEMRNFRMDGVHIVASGARNGWALRLQRLVRSVIRDVTVDPVEVGWRNSHGVWVNGFDDLTLDNVGANARTKSLQINGSTNGWGADLYMTGGAKLTTYQNLEPGVGEAAIHIAGNAGGVYLEAADVIYSTVGLLIDTAANGLTNREVFLGAGLFFDSAGEDCVRLGPKACTTLMANGTWMATAGLSSGGFPNGNGLNVHHDNPQLVGQLSGVKAFNCAGTGLAISGGRWIIGGATAIHNNGGYGLHRANVKAAITRGSLLAFSNARGDYAGF